MSLCGCCPSIWGKSEKSHDEFEGNSDKQIVEVHLPRKKLTSDVSFTINGKLYNITGSETLPVDTSLNTFIRQHAHLPGTKFMCLEGGCGACIVSVSGIHPVTKEKTTWSVNSCLFPVFSCHGLDITTIEGLGNKKDGYHDLQTRLANFNGTQCGYCSPAWVMSMHSLLESSKGQLTMEQIENSFGGNICRCTGYRPIMDAFKSVAVDATEELKNAIKDIEDLDKICKTTGKACTGTCSAATKAICGVKLADDTGKEWHKVTKVTEIFEILNKIPNRKYMLVHGNTAHGVYRRDPDIQVFIDVSNVDELHSYSMNKDSLILGANVSLTETMNILTDAATKFPDFEYCKEIVKHIDLVAHVPVRNAGTLAGNLSIKHEHVEFPSDIFLLLETTGATLTIAEADGKTSSVKPSEYLKTQMSNKVITKITLPPLPVEKYIFRSYKIMPRAQNAHAYVNAGFLIEINDKRDKVMKANFVYGGIRPEFIHASKLEQYLSGGKDLFSNVTLGGATKALASELNPDWVLPDPSPDFRKNLAIALFYKFLLSIAPDGKIKSEFKTGGETLKRPLSSGTQTFDTHPENYPLTKAIPKIEGVIQCAGEAQYVNDIPSQPNELWAAFVIARKVGAKIVRLDASEVLKMKGVRFFFDAKDIPGVNSFMTKKLMMVFEDEEIFCSDEVKYNGQPAGMILADTMEIANFAANHVKIVYGERVKKDIYPTIKDVYNANATERLFETPFKTPSTEEGNLDGTVTIKDRFEMSGQYHFTMETQSCVTIPSDEGIDVYSATQWMDLTQICVADALKIPTSSVNVYTKRLGGGYGSKISRATLVACAAALGTHLTNRPVRFVMTVEQNMEAIGKRHGVISDYEIQVDSNGVIQKLKNNYSEDYGHSSNEPVIFTTNEFFGNCYEKSRMTYEGKAAITDAAANTWCRAPGTTEGIAMTENMLEHIAHVVKKDPAQVRLENLAKDSEMKKLMPEFLKDVEYYERKKAIDEFNSKNRWRKRGIAVVPMRYPMGYFGTMHAHVSIYHGDGTVAITHGGIEMGQGINTKVAQVAAHVLGINLNMIHLKQSNSLTSANDVVSGGSQASEAICYAVKKACEELLERIKPVREKNSDKEWADLIQIAFNENVDLVASFMFKNTDVQPYIIWGLSCAEIEIDLLTGNYILTRVDILEDTGESMSPNVDIGQVEGAFVMGMGYWLQEVLVYDNASGQLVSNRTWNYKPPTVKDIPVDFRIKFLQKSKNPYGVLRSKATGEPATCMSIVVIFAVRHALNSARKDAGLGDDWYHLGAPTTCEDIFLLGGGTKTENFVLN
uniref:CSON013979 protein n=1 Tax=Culicoides sonorensis TaxID=179676 RepID=A0A336MA50_CULSO